MSDVSIYKWWTVVCRKPENALNFGIKNLERCFKDINDESVEKITHICCGYPDKLDAIDYPKAL